MSIFIQFAILGLGTGALYAFAAQGLVLVYRASGVLNFANGAIGVSVGYVYYELRTYHHWSFIAAFIASLAVAFVFGCLWQMLVMKRLRRRSGLVRVVATLGLLIALQGAAGNIFKANDYLVPSTLPVHVWHLGKTIVITSDRIYLLVIVVVLTAILWAAYKFTIFGIGTSAVSESPRAASALGWSFDFIAAVNWGLGCALTGAATIFLLPIITLSVSAMTALLLTTLAVALVGNFSSFWWTLVGGLGIGVLQGELTYYTPQWGTWATGLAASAPFFVIMGVLVVRGRSLPMRDYFLQRNPTLGSGRIRPWLVITSFAVMFVITLFANDNWAAGLATTFAAAVILLSIVILLGYAGQLSLAQSAFAGFGCYVAAELVANAHLSFVPSMILGILAAVPVGALFGLPAVRTRGMNLAIVTFGLGAAVEFMLFDNASYTGVQGLNVGSPSLFGWDIDSFAHPTRWACFCLVMFTLAALAVVNLRRGRTGRGLIAVRNNERAAAALGINVPAMKLYAFALAAGVAALGGVLTYFAQVNVVMSTVSNSISPTYVAQAVIGGVGFAFGPLVGGNLAIGGTGQVLTNELFGSTVGSYLTTFSGVVLLLTLLQAPDGIVELNLKQWRQLARRPRSFIMKRVFRPAKPTSLGTSDTTPFERVTPCSLEVRDVTVRYGGVVACDSVSLSIKPGHIVGLIGPNGAGKTTLIDTIAGFTRPASGSIRYGDQDITRWTATKRARAGISRTFQSLELYDDMTVLDNLRAAFETRSVWAGVSDLVWPRTPPVPATAVAAVREFQLDSDLDLIVENLSYGQRRLLAAARAVAASPSVLLLDECAAGLSEAESRELATLVRRLADTWGMGILVIEHDVNFVMSICDEVVVLDFGRKIAHGVPADVRVDPAVIAAYLGEPEEEVSGRV